MEQTSIVEVLLVEDTPTDAELCLRALRKHKLAKKVHWVKGGAEALDFLFPAGGTLRPTPRVILLDLKLPRVDGLEVLRKLKSDENTKTIPVVVLTSSTEDCDIAEAYRLGANMTRCMNLRLAPSHVYRRDWQRGRFASGEQLVERRNLLLVELLP